MTYPYPTLSLLLFLELKSGRAMVYTDGTYLIAHSDKELSEFIHELKLPQEHLNSTSCYPHYRIPTAYQNTVLEAVVIKVNHRALLLLAAQIYGKNIFM